MSQHDFDISAADAPGGAAYRAQVNLALKALASQSIGSTSPAVTYPGMPWADTSADLYKIRNAANTAWISFMTLSTGRPVWIPSNVDATELGYLHGVTSPIQEQLSTISENIDFYWNNISAVQGSFTNLKLSTTGSSPVVTYSADAIVLKSASGRYITRSSVSLTASTGSASGSVNGLDTGSWAYSTWYYIHHVYNPTTLADGLIFSLSVTAPTLPSGYTLWARIGSFRTPSATNYYPLGFTQFGRTVQYRVAAGSNITAPLTMASGTSITVWTAVSTTSFVPITASKIRLQMMISNQANGAQLSVAPNSAYTLENAPLMFQNSSIYKSEISLVGDMILESNNVYWGGNGYSTVFLYCLGWEENL